MKLNFDCVRDVLLELENLPLNETISADELIEPLAQYDEDTILYTCMKLIEADYLDANYSKYIDGGYSIIIKDITFIGHQFLADIHSDTVWNKVKNVAGIVGSTSIKALTQIATSVVTEIIRQQLGFI